MLAGVRLKGNVVILDEAHNVAPTVSALHSGSVTLSQARARKPQRDAVAESVHLTHCAVRPRLHQTQAAQRQLAKYHKRYQQRLAGKNLFYVNQVGWRDNPPHSFPRVRW